MRSLQLADFCSKRHWLSHKNVILTACDIVGGAGGRTAITTAGADVVATSSSLASGEGDGEGEGEGEGSNGEGDGEDPVRVSGEGADGEGANGEGTSGDGASGEGVGEGSDGGSSVVVAGSGASAGVAFGAAGHNALTYWHPLHTAHCPVTTARAEAQASSPEAASLFSDK
mmetsp:Transcript_152871/g.490382  ORF Transcript_152871/g.490382 Transcript_152871/m.490382 type:complete len:171 (-) Transcript_152871:1825-2337(-)